MTRTARAARRRRPPRPRTQPASGPREGRRLGPGGRDVLLLAALATALYANSFGVPLVLDSQLLVVQDPRIRAAGVENVRSILTGDYLPAGAAVSGVYRPLTTLSFLGNYAILGNDARPAGYHAVNLLLHVANAALVYLLAGTVLRSRVYALCTAALFTAHPIATEAVTNVVGRADLLAALAVLAGTLLHIRSSQAVGRARLGWLAGLAVVTMLGLLAKENAIAIVGVMLAYDLTYRVRSVSERGLADTLRRPGALLRSGYVALVPALLVAGWLRWRVYANTVVERTPFIDNPLVGADFWSARLTAIKVLGRSVALLVWPRTLSWDYSYDQIPLVRWPPTTWEDWQALLAIAGLAAAAAVAVRSRRRRPALCFFLLFTLVTMLPTANLLVLIGTIMGERLLYLPSVGFAACAVLGISAIGARLRRPEPAVSTAIVVALVVAACGARTIARNHDWRDEVRLARSGIEAAPRSAKVYLQSSSALSRRDGERADADALVANGERALSIMEHPPLPIELQASPVLLMLGIAYKTKGTQLASRGTDGREWYQRAAAMLERATRIEAAINDEYGQASLRRGVPKERIPELGARELPYNLGETYLLLGEPAQAAEAFARLRRLAPLASQTHDAVARAAVATGDLAQAVRALTIAMTLGRRDPETRQLLLDTYRRLDPDGCAVREREGRQQLDRSCPVVRTQACAANLELVELAAGAGQSPLARGVADAAVRAGGCDPAPFQRALASPAAATR